MRRSARKPARYAGSHHIPAPQARVPHFIKTSLVPARAGLAGDDAVQQMASDMREASHREGGLTRDGLELLGWLPEQIDAIGSKARRMAQLQAAMS